MDCTIYSFYNSIEPTKSEKIIKIVNEKDTFNPSRNPKVTNYQNKIIIDESESTQNKARNDKKGFQSFQVRPVKIGEEYQAEIPEFIPKHKRSPKDLSEKALKIWRPTKKLSDIELDEYLKETKKHKYTEEQALGLLFWHRYDINTALETIDDFIPFK